MCVKVQTHYAQGTFRKLITDELLAEMFLLAQPGKKYTYLEIADATHLTPERIRQIENEALRKLRKNPEVNRLWKEMFC